MRERKEKREISGNYLNIETIAAWDVTDFLPLFSPSMLEWYKSHMTPNERVQPNDCQSLLGFMVITEVRPIEVEGTNKYFAMVWISLLKLVLQFNCPHDDTNRVNLWEVSMPRVLPFWINGIILGLGQLLQEFSRQVSVPRACLPVLLPCYGAVQSSSPDISATLLDSSFQNQEPSKLPLFKNPPV